LDHVLDQKLARTDYLNLFRQLDDAGVGRLIFGRRGHATRFKAWASDSLQTALSEMGITANDPFWKEPRLNPVTTASVNASVGVTPAATSPNRPTRESVVAELRKHQDEIRNFGVRSLGLFGSVARDEATPESDIDLLVTFKDSVTSDGFFGVKFFLEDLLGRRIDLVTDSALREPLRTAIQRELVNVA
jgi:predicted nucleotidyltransferase